jgi:putative tricarboxylic transport membrane protein
MATTTRRVELGVLIALLLLAVLVVWQATSMPMGSARLPGAGMLPLILGSLLGLSVLVMLPPYLRSEATGGEAIRLANRSIGIAVLSLIGAGLLLERAGFVLTATLYLFVMLWSVSPLGWWRSLIAAAVTAAIARFLFADILGVSLPPMPWIS